MKKLLIFILSVLTLTICLSGCYPNKKMYDQEDADKVTAKGTEMMQVVRPIVQQNHTTVGVGGFEARVDKNGMLRKGFKGVLEMPAERGKRVAETAELIKNILTCQKSRNAF